MNEEKLMRISFLVDERNKYISTIEHIPSRFFNVRISDNISIEIADVLFKKNEEVRKEIYDCLCKKLREIETRLDSLGYEYEKYDILPYEQISTFDSLKNPYERQELSDGVVERITIGPQHDDYLNVHENSITIIQQKYFDRFRKFE